MSKTAPIPDDIHALIIDKQTELKRRHKISVKISDIIALVMKNNIHKVGRYLGLRSDEELNITDDIRIKDENGNDTEENAMVKPR